MFSHCFQKDCPAFMEFNSIQFNSMMNYHPLLRKQDVPLWLTKYWIGHIISTASEDATVPFALLDAKTFYMK